MPAGSELGFDEIRIRTSDERNQLAVAAFPYGRPGYSGTENGKVEYKESEYDKREYLESEYSSPEFHEPECGSSEKCNALEYHGTECSSPEFNGAEYGGAEEACSHEKNGTTEPDAPPLVTENGADLMITGKGFAYTLDTLSGRFTSLKRNDREMLRQPIDFNLWRAPTDNDVPLLDLWKFERLDHTVTRAYDVTHEICGNTAVLHIRQSVAAFSNHPVLRIQTTCRIYPDGTIRMEIHAEKEPNYLTLPRRRQAAPLVGVQEPLQRNQNR